MLKYEELPSWLLALDSTDISFIKNIIVHNGSLKEVAQAYDVSYPTIRLRFDRLIDKINENDKSNDDAFTLKVKSLAIDEKIDFDTAKELISEYRKMKK
ncbi:MAG: DUF2089 domain-containing protein [Acholeplasmatales bacterium]|nr:DUF2089 domain-containing protein [Acholeplasmatales bacterium]